MTDNNNIKIIGKKKYAKFSSFTLPTRVHADRCVSALLGESGNFYQNICTCVST